MCIANLIRFSDDWKRDWNKAGTKKYQDWLLWCSVAVQVVSVTKVFNSEEQVPFEVILSILCVN
jgi:hypothetical protein